MARVVVLGGTGWVGRHVCAAFAREGHHVVAVARHPDPSVAAHGFVVLDIVAAPAARIAGLADDARADVVVNAVDGANARDGWDHAEQWLAEANVGMVERLVAGLTRAARPPRLVHIGTIHEYGPVPPGTAIHERLPAAPATVYSRTKLAGSRVVLDAVGRGLDGVVLRLANVCGPHPSPASFPGKLLRLLRAAVAQRRPLEVALAPGGRDYLDVRDAAEAVVRAAGAAAGGEAVVNIGSGRAVSSRELVETLVAVAGLAPDVIRDTGEPVTSLGGEWTRADIRLAAASLGWTPAIPLAESLRAMWERGG